MSQKHYFYGPISPCGGLFPLYSHLFDQTDPGRIATAYQNFIICIEMFFVSLAHLKAFPHKEYVGQNAQYTRRLASLQRVSSNLKKVRVLEAVTESLSPDFSVDPILDALFDVACSADIESAGHCARHCPQLFFQIQPLPSAGAVNCNIIETDACFVVPLGSPRSSLFLPWILGLPSSLTLSPGDGR